MKNREYSTVLKSSRTRLVTLALAGLIVLPLQVARAEGQGGKDRAQDNVAAVRRDPFWPVGYEPKQVFRSAESDTPVEPKILQGGIDWEEAMKQVVINGVSSRATDEYIAVINNEVKSVGDHVSIEKGGVKYTWKVESITPPGSVKLRRHAAQ